MMTALRRCLGASLVMASTMSVAACGGDAAGPQTAIEDPGMPDDASGVEEVLVTMAPALAGGEGQRVCSLVTPDRQRAMEARTSAASCIEAVRALSEASERATLRAASGWTIDVSGTKAKVTGTTASTLARAVGADTLEFGRVDSRWNLL